jgi:flagellar biosynthesis protein FliR
MELLQIPGQILQNYNVIWTFLLLITRFTGFLSIMPGLGMGTQGLRIRFPAILVLAVASQFAGQSAELPPNHVMLFAGLASEFIFGALLGMIPLIMVSAIELAGQLAASTMGLGAAQIINPTTGANTQALAKIFGDVVILAFLVLGGHHYMVYAVAGLGGQIVPGSFQISNLTVEVLIDQTAAIFQAGAILSAPIIVALLLTQFVMGLVSRTVSTINIFIVSFPLTIGVGLLLSILALPEMLGVAIRQMTAVEGAVATIVQDTTLVQAK